MIYPELQFKITKTAWRERIQFTQNIKKMRKNRLNYLISQPRTKNNNLLTSKIGKQMIKTIKKVKNNKFKN